MLQGAEEAFITSEVSSDNLSELSRMQSLLAERRICELHEMAESAVSYLRSLYESGMPIADALSLVDPFSESDTPLHAEAMKENLSHLRASARATEALDKAVFISLMIEELSALGKRPSEADFLSPSAQGEMFTYVKNFYADEAYDVFSQSFSDPRLFYSETIRDAVKAVEEGRAGFCLLPLEEKGGVRLGSISQLLYKSDLRIASVTPVYGYGEQTDLTYALISRGYLIPELSGEDDRYLEIRLPKKACPLSELLFVTEAYGLQIHRIHSLILEEEGGHLPFYSLVVRAEGRDFVPFLTYLCTFVGDFAPIGIYSNLDA